MVKLKQLVVFISLSVVAISSLLGCGVSKHPPMNFTGAILGWNNNLYKLTSSISPRHMEKKLGAVTYHGSISESFTIFQLSGSSPAKAVVFESEDGHFYKAVVTKSN